MQFLFATSLKRSALGMFICIKGIVEERLDIIFSATKSKRSKKEKASKIYIDEVTTGNVSEDGNVEYFVN